MDQCTRNTRGRGRVIERTEHAAYIEQNRKNIEKHKHFYKRRQAIVEHSYGTIKRQWGFSYILTKQGKARASADVGFMFIAYNLKRLINIIGQEGFKKYLKALMVRIFAFLSHFRGKLSLYKSLKFYLNISQAFHFYIQKRIIFERKLINNGGF